MQVDSLTQRASLKLLQLPTMHTYNFYACFLGQTWENGQARRKRRDQLDLQSLTISPGELRQSLSAPKHSVMSPETGPQKEETKAFTMATEISP